MSQGLANTVQEGTFESVGLNIFYRAWRPTGRPRGVVCMDARRRSSGRRLS
jgi:hypothetical protein